MRTEDVLDEAIKSGGVLKIVYLGGSQPGAIRTISPISIKNGLVRAHCHSSDAVKSFAIRKIELVEEEGSRPKGPEWDPDAKPTARYESVRDILEKEMRVLSNLGWHVESKESRLTLHRRFKNGKPLKGYDVSINYEEFTYDLVAGPGGEILKENHRKRVRPWSVRGANKNTRSYGNLDHAASLFLEWAELLAPSKTVES